MLQKGIQFNPEHLSSFVVRVKRDLESAEGWYYLGPGLKDGLPVMWEHGEENQTWFHESFYVHSTIELAEATALLLQEMLHKPVEILQIHLRGSLIHLLRIAKIVTKA
jgi:hypothetical protein